MRCTIKKQVFLWAALAVMVSVSAAAAQARTVTLDYNYSGAPANITIATDAHGSIMRPLPAPTRPGQAFSGWFTTASGNPATMVLSGATGTKFNANTTIYARWSPVTAVSMSSIPAAFKENFDWMRFERHDKGLPGYLNGTPERIFFNANGSVRQRNSIFHMIWEGQGTINWAVRWESGRRITLAERQNMARMLHESINVWARPLIGMPNWPFGEIQVNLVGWAVRDASVIVDRQPNEQVWVNSNHFSPFGDNNFAATRDFMASAPSELSRFIQFGGSGNVNRAYNYPGGLHARFDMYQWVTAGFGGAVGGDWGNRLGDTRVIGYGSGVNAQGANTLNGVQTHEVGHSFGLYDLYGETVRRPPNTTAASPGGERVFGRGDLVTVMDRTYNGPLNSYDQWQIRYYWDWLYNGTPANDRNRLFPTYSVTVSGGGTGAAGGGNYAAGNTVILNAGTRSGYTFSGWTTTSAGVTVANTANAAATFAMPANAVTVTANWIPGSGTVTTHTIAFNANGGTGTMTSDNVTQGGNYTIKANTFTRAGHTFAGWRTAATGGTSYAAGATISNVTANITLYAQWTAIPRYAVSFNANGGTGTMAVDSVTQGNNYTIKANTFTRTGFTFAGWRTAATGGTSYAAGAQITNVTANITLFAQWTAIPRYAISFNANSGTGTMAVDSVTQGNNYTIKANTFTRDGFTFAGWRTGATSGTRYDAGAQITNVTANITLFAQWTAIPRYAVSFNANSGTGTMAVDSVTQGNNYTIKANTFTRDGFTFAGWRTGATSGTRYDAGAQMTNVTANVTLFAQWEEVLTTSTLQVNRLVPGPQPGEEAYRPLTVSVAEFVAGPNPVSKSAGEVNFFRQGKRVDSAMLTIFDASGNMINKIRVNDNGAGDQSRRVIATWNLTDAKGRTVSEGMYLVRGTVTTSDGKRERVSLMVGVR